MPLLVRQNNRREGQGVFGCNWQLQLVAVTGASLLSLFTILVLFLPFPHGSAAMVFPLPISPGIEPECSGLLSCASALAESAERASSTQAVQPGIQKYGRCMQGLIAPYPTDGQS